MKSEVLGTCALWLCGITRWGRLAYEPFAELTCECLLGTTL